MAMVRVSKGDEETPEVGGMVVMGGAMVVVGAVVDEGMAGELEEWWQRNSQTSGLTSIPNCWDRCYYSSNSSRGT